MSGENGPHYFQEKEAHYTSVSGNGTSLHQGKIYSLHQCQRRGTISISGKEAYLISDKGKRTTLTSGKRGLHGHQRKGAILAIGDKGLH